MYLRLTKDPRWDNQGRGPTLVINPCIRPGISLLSNWPYPERLVLIIIPHPLNIPLQILKVLSTLVYMITLMLSHLLSQACIKLLTSKLLSPLGPSQGNTIWDVLQSLLLDLARYQFNVMITLHILCQSSKWQCKWPYLLGMLLNIIGQVLPWLSPNENIRLSKIIDKVNDNVIRKRLPIFTSHLVDS